jgi:predicted unusual protein kinase regulating ubiquinone biosynthesis (AarF/ABC1/UbiB family)
MLLPKEFKAFISLVPSLSLDMINLKDLGKSAFKTFKRSDKKKRIQNIEKLSQKMTLENFIISKEQIEGEKVSEEDEASKVLSFYFEQLSFDGPIFLDLRSDYFKKHDNKIYFSPGNLYYQFSKGFLQGIQDLYSSFYNERHNDFAKALLDLGLLHEALNDQQKNEVIRSFYKHFAGAKNEKMKLDLNYFKESFNSIFSIMKKNKIKVSVDFAYFGLYLTTLYMHLDQIDAKLDIEKAYRESNLSKL